MINLKLKNLEVAVVLLVWGALAVSLVLHANRYVDHIQAVEGRLIATESRLFKLHEKVLRDEAYTYYRPVCEKYSSLAGQYYNVSVTMSDDGKKTPVAQGYCVHYLETGDDIRVSVDEAARVIQVIEKREVGNE